MGTYAIHKQFEMLLKKQMVGQNMQSPASEGKETLVSTQNFETEYVSHQDDQQSQYLPHTLSLPQEQKFSNVLQ